MSNNAPQLIPMKKWMRNSSLKFFERNPEAIGAPGFVSLSNPIIVNVLSTNFEPFTRDTYYITVRARSILSENRTRREYREDELFQAEMALATYLDRLNEYFDTRIEQGMQKLQLNGFGESAIKRVLTNYETISVHAYVTQFIDILAKADFYLAIIHYLWLTGELSDSMGEATRLKLTTENETRDTLYELTRLSIKHSQNIQRIVTGAIEQRNAKRAKQAQKDQRRKARLEKLEAEREAATKARQKAARLKRQQEREASLKEANTEQANLAAAVA